MRPLQMLSIVIFQKGREGKSIQRFQLQTSSSSSSSSTCQPSSGNGSEKGEAALTFISFLIFLVCGVAPSPFCVVTIRLIGDTQEGFDQDVPKLDDPEVKADQVDQVQLDAGIIIGW